MRRAFALTLLFFAIDAIADEKPLVPFDLVKMGVKLLQVRGVTVRGETRGVEFRDGKFRMRVKVTPHQTVVVDLNAGVPLRNIESPLVVTEAIALSSSHYMLTIADPPGDFDLAWQPEIEDVPEMAVFADGNSGVVMIVPPADESMSGVELRFDDPSAVATREREGDLVVVSVKFGSAAGRVMASGRISGQEWHDVKPVCEDVCATR
jgi:hypothetical protein